MWGKLVVQFHAFAGHCPVFPTLFFEVAALYHFAFLLEIYESSICWLGVLLLELVVKETVYLGKINFGCLVST